MLTKYYDLLSENDKKRLQEEKIRMDIEKTKKDIDGDNGNSQENEVAAMLRKMVKPHGT